MKKLMSAVRWLVKVPLPVLCYCLAILGWLAVCTVQLTVDSIQMGSGRLAQQTLTPAEFVLSSLELQADGGYLATTDDPQLILDVSGQTVRTLRFSAEFSAAPYEMCLYYTTAPDEDFGQNKRVWPVQQADGSYLFVLPRTSIYSLRLDPASAVLEIRFGDIVLNEPQAPIDYYNPGWYGLFLLVAMPAFAAAVLRWLADVARHYRGKAKTGKALPKGGAKA